MNLFWEIHSGLPQEGPGDDNSTLKALALIPDLPSNPSILDIACGPGRQTIALAKQTLRAGTANYSSGQTNRRTDNRS